MGKTSVSKTLDPSSFFVNLREIAETKSLGRWEAWKATGNNRLEKVEGWKFIVEKIKGFFSFLGGVDKTNVTLVEYEFLQILEKCKEAGISPTDENIELIKTAARNAGLVQITDNTSLLNETVSIVVDNLFKDTDNLLTTAHEKIDSFYNNNAILKKIWKEPPKHSIPVSTLANSILKPSPAKNSPSSDASSTKPEELPPPSETALDPQKLIQTFAYTAPVEDAKEDSVISQEEKHEQGLETSQDDVQTQEENVASHEEKGQEPFQTSQDGIQKQETSSNFIGTILPQSLQQPPSIAPSNENTEKDPFTSSRDAEKEPFEATKEDSEGLSDGSLTQDSPTDTPHGQLQQEPSPGPSPTISHKTTSAQSLKKRKLSEAMKPAQNRVYSTAEKIVAFLTVVGGGVALYFARSWTPSPMPAQELTTTTQEPCFPYEPIQDLSQRIFTPEDSKITADTIQQLQEFLKVTHPLHELGEEYSQIEDLSFKKGQTPSLPLENLEAVSEAFEYLQILTNTPVDASEFSLKPSNVAKGQTLQDISPNEFLEAAEPKTISETLEELVLPVKSSIEEEVKPMEAVTNSTVNPEVETATCPAPTNVSHISSNPSFAIKSHENIDDSFAPPEIVPETPVPETIQGTQVPDTAHETEVKQAGQETLVEDTIHRTYSYFEAFINVASYLLPIASLGGLAWTAKRRFSKIISLPEKLPDETTDRTQRKTIKDPVQDPEQAKKIIIKQAINKLLGPPLPKVMGSQVYEPQTDFFQEIDNLNFELDISLLEFIKTTISNQLKEKPPVYVVHDKAISVLNKIESRIKAIKEKSPQTEQTQPPSPNMDMDFLKNNIKNNSELPVFFNIDDFTRHYVWQVGGEHDQSYYNDYPYFDPKQKAKLQLVTTEVAADIVPRNGDLLIPITTSIKEKEVNFRIPFDILFSAYAKYAKDNLGINSIEDFINLRNDQESEKGKELFEKLTNNEIHLQLKYDDIVFNVTLSKIQENKENKEYRKKYIGTSFWDLMIQHEDGLEHPYGRHEIKRGGNRIKYPRPSEYLLNKVRAEKISSVAESTDNALSLKDSLIFTFDTDKKEFLPSSPPPNKSFKEVIANSNRPIYLLKDTLSMKDSLKLPFWDDQKTLIAVGDNHLTIFQEFDPLKYTENPEEKISEGDTPNRLIYISLPEGLSQDDLTTMFKTSEMKNGILYLSLKESPNDKSQSEEDAIAAPEVIGIVQTLDPTWDPTKSVFLGTIPGNTNAREQEFNANVLDFDIGDPTPTLSNNIGPAEGLEQRHQELNLYLKEKYLLEEHPLPEDLYKIALANNDSTLLSLLVSADIKYKGEDEGVQASIQQMKDAISDLKEYLDRKYHVKFESVAKFRQDGCPLHFAVLKVDPDWNLFKKYIAAGVDVNQKDPQGNSVLMAVCQVKSQNTNFKDIEDAIEELIAQGQSLKESNKLGDTPLLIAVENANAKIVEMLIEKGADVNFADKYGDTPLLRAVKNGDSDLFKMLVEKGASLEIPDKQGRTPLNEAIRTSNQEIYNYLLPSRDPPKVHPLAATLDRMGRSPLSYALRNQLPKEIIAQLVHPEMINQPDREGRTPLHDLINVAILEPNRKSAGLDLSTKYLKSLNDNYLELLNKRLFPAGADPELLLSPYVDKGSDKNEPLKPAPTASINTQNPQEFVNNLYKQYEGLPTHSATFETIKLIKECFEQAISNRYIIKKVPPSDTNLEDSAVLSQSTTLARSMLNASQVIQGHQISNVPQESLTDSLIASFVLMDSQILDPPPQHFEHNCRQIMDFAYRPDTAQLTHYEGYGLAIGSSSLENMVNTVMRWTPEDPLSCLQATTDYALRNLTACEKALKSSLLETEDYINKEIQHKQALCCVIELNKGIQRYAELDYNAKQETISKDKWLETPIAQLAASFTASIGKNQSPLVSATETQPNEDLATYCRIFSPNLSPPKATAFIEKGRILCQKVLSGEVNTLSRDSEEAKEELAALTWYFMDLALGKKQGFDEGTFVIEDPEQKLYNFLNSAPAALIGSRYSSHFLGRSSGEHALFGAIHRGIDITTASMPGGKRTVDFDMVECFQSTQKMLYFKPENWGTFLTTGWGLDTMMHGYEFLEAQYVKRFVPGGDDLPSMQKERVPTDLTKGFGNIIKTLRANKEVEAAFIAAGLPLASAEKEAKKWGVAYINHFLNKCDQLLVTNPVYKELEAPAIELRKYIKKISGNDPVEWRTGREVILTLQDLQKPASETKPGPTPPQTPSTPSPLLFKEEATYTTTTTTTKQADSKTTEAFFEENNVPITSPITLDNLKDEIEDNQILNTFINIKSGSDYLIWGANEERSKATKGKFYYELCPYFDPSSDHQLNLITPAHPEGIFIQPADGDLIVPLAINLKGKQLCFHLPAQVLLEFAKNDNDLLTLKYGNISFKIRPVKTPSGTVLPNREFWELYNSFEEIAYKNPYASAPEPGLDLSKIPQYVKPSAIYLKVQEKREALQMAKSIDSTTADNLFLIFNPTTQTFLKGKSPNSFEKIITDSKYHTKILSFNHSLLEPGGKLSFPFIDNLGSFKINNFITFANNSLFILQEGFLEEGSTIHSRSHWYNSLISISLPENLSALDIESMFKHAKLTNGLLTLNLPPAPIAEPQITTITTTTTTIPTTETKSDETASFNKTNSAAITKMGIPNTGNACYRNAANQILRAIPTFRERIAQELPEIDKPSDELSPVLEGAYQEHLEERNKKEALRKALNQLFLALETEGITPEELKSKEEALCDALFNINEGDFDLRRAQTYEKLELKKAQYDSADYVRIILNMLNLQMSGTIEQWVHQDLTASIGPIKFDIEEKKFSEPFFTIYLSNANSTDVQELINSSFSEIKIDASDFRQKKRIQGPPPENLVVYFQRGGLVGNPTEKEIKDLEQEAAIFSKQFGWLPEEEEAYFDNKLELLKQTPKIVKTPLNFPKTLDLSQAFNEKVEAKYELAGFVRHHSAGFGPGGHYTAHVKEGKIWRHFDDATVTVDTPEEVAKESSQAYIAFFSLVQ